MFSLSPGTPAFRQQMPRIIISTLTPAQDASYRAVMISLSHREFILAIMWAGRPALACSVSLRIMRRNLPLSQRGATDSLFQARGSE